MENLFKRELNTLINSFEKQIKSVKTLSELENIRIKYLGRKGKINDFFAKIKLLNPEERKSFGKKINNSKKIIENALKKKSLELTKQTDFESLFDPTLPGTQFDLGSIHPISKTIEKICNIFSKIGFIRVSYREIEWEYFVFDVLNMPSNHPARDDFETMYLDLKPHNLYGELVLTPHTSSGQVREMHRAVKPPIKMINIGRCYRKDCDATHTPTLHQFEGLCISEDINITHLKGTIEYFVKSYFGKRSLIRLRPHHFQFTEPSFEIDISCNICNGSTKINNNKCKVCKSGWLELGGSGMVHPYVLSKGNIDPKKYSGWAFGFGIERLLMMKYHLDDIRLLYDGNIQLLKQFSIIY